MCVERRRLNLNKQTVHINWSEPQEEVISRSEHRSETPCLKINESWNVFASLLLDRRSWWPMSKTSSRIDFHDVMSGRHAHSFSSFVRSGWYHRMTPPKGMQWRKSTLANQTTETWQTMSLRTIEWARDIFASHLERSNWLIRQLNHALDLKISSFASLHFRRWRQRLRRDEIKADDSAAAVKLSSLFLSPLSLDFFPLVAWGIRQWYCERKKICVACNETIVRCSSTSDVCRLWKKVRFAATSVTQASRAEGQQPKHMWPLPLASNPCIKVLSETNDSVSVGYFLPT